MPRIPRPIPFALVLVAAALTSPVVPASATPPLPVTMTYSVTDSWLEGPTHLPPITLHVVQEDQRAVARLRPGDAGVHIVSDPANGVPSAARAPGSRGPVLRLVIDGPESLAVGDPVEWSGREAPDTVRAIRYELRRGDDDRKIFDRPAIHSVLTVEIELARTQADGSDETELVRGQSDLWTLPDLPFSWIPYTASTALQAMAAIPFALEAPQVASFLLQRHADELRDLGLLARAEIRTTSEITGSYPRESSTHRELVVTDLEVGVGDFAVEIPTRAALGTTRYGNLFAAAYGAHYGCGDTAAGSRLELDVDPTASTRLEGRGLARLVEPERLKPKGALLVMSSGLPTGSTKEVCAQVVVSTPELEAGDFAITDRDVDASGSLAGVFVAVVNQEYAESVVLVESGTVAIRHDGDAWTGRVQGQGIVIETPNRETSRLYENVQLVLHFDIERPVPSPAELTPEPPPADPTPEVAWSWSPSTFDPALGEPSARWESGDDAPVVAIDTSGRVAAAALRKGKVVQVLDLEDRSVRREIDLSPFLPHPHQAVQRVVLASDGGTIAVSTTEEILIFDTASGTRSKRLPLPRTDTGVLPARSMAFELSGAGLVISSGNEIFRYEIADEVPEPELRYEQEEGFHYLLTPTPDGSTWVAIAHEEGLRVFSWPTFDETCRVPGAFSALATHPGGERVAALGQGNAGLTVVDLANCEVTDSWPEVEARAVQWAGDGEHLILAASTRMFVVDPVTGEALGDWPGTKYQSLVAAPGSARFLAVDRAAPASLSMWE